MRVLANLRIGKLPVIVAVTCVGMMLDSCGEDPELQLLGKGHATKAQAKASETDSIQDAELRRLHDLMALRVQYTSGNQTLDQELTGEALDETLLLSCYLQFQSTPACTGTFPNIPNTGALIGSTGSPGCNTGVCEAQIELCAAHMALEIASIRARPIEFDMGGGVVYSVRPQSTATNAEMAGLAARWSAAAAALSLNELQVASGTGTSLSFSCGWTAADQQQFGATLTQTVLEASEVYREAIDRVVETTVASADQQFGSDPDLGTAAGRAWAGMHLSRAAAAHWLIGGDAGLSGSTVDALCAAPPPKANVQAAIDVFREAAPDPSVITQPATYATDDLVQGTVPNESIRARLAELYPANASEINSKDIWALYGLDREDFLDARDYLAKEITTFGRSLTWPAPARPLTGGGRTTKRRFASTATPPGAQVDAYYVALTDTVATQLVGTSLSQIARPSWWFDGIANRTSQQTLARQNNIFATYSFNHVAFNLFSGAKNTLTNGTAHLDSSISANVIGALGTLAGRWRNDGVGSVNISGGFTLVTGSGAGTRIVVGEEGVQCAVLGRVEGQKCKASDLTNLTAVELANSPCGPTMQCSIGSFNASAMMGKRLYVVAPTSPSHVPGNYRALTGGLFNGSAAWAFLADGPERVAKVMKPDPAWCARAFVTCADGPVDARLPLEDELSQDNDNVESSWRHYLDLAKQAADEADMLGDKVIEFGLGIDEKNEQVILERLARTEQATQQLQNICGTDIDLTTIANTIGGSDGLLGLDNLSQGACTNGTCSGKGQVCVEGTCMVDPIKIVLDNAPNDASTARLKQCIDEGNVLPLVAVGDTNLCLWTDPNDPNTLCPEAGTLGHDFFQPDATPQPAECPILLPLDDKSTITSPFTGLLCATKLALPSDIPLGAVTNTLGTLDYFSASGDVEGGGVPKSTAPPCLDFRQMRLDHDKARFEAIKATSLYNPKGGLADLAPAIGWEARYGGYSAITLYGSPIYSTGSPESGPETEGWPCDTGAMPDECYADKRAELKLDDLPADPTNWPLFCYPRALGANFCQDDNLRAQMNEHMLHAVMALRLSTAQLDLQTKTYSQALDKLLQKINSGTPVTFGPPLGGSGAIMLPFYVAAEDLNHTHQKWTTYKPDTPKTRTLYLNGSDSAHQSAYPLTIESAVDQDDDKAPPVVGTVYRVSAGAPQDDLARKAWFPSTGTSYFNVNATSFETRVDNQPLRFAIGAIETLIYPGACSGKCTGVIGSFAALLRDPVQWYAGMNDDPQYVLPGAPTTSFIHKPKTEPFGWIQLALLGQQFPTVHTFDMPTRWFDHGVLVVGDVVSVSPDIHESPFLTSAAVASSDDVETYFPFIQHILPPFRADPNTMLDGAELLCQVAKDDSPDGCQAEAPKIASLEQLGQARAYLHCAAKGIQERAAKTVLAKVPEQALDALRKQSSFGSFPSVGGDYGQALADLRASLVELSAVAPTIADNLRELGDDLQYIRDRARQLGITQTLEQNKAAIEFEQTVANQQAACEAAASSAIGGILDLNIGSVGSAIATCANSASQIHLAQELKATIDQGLAASTKAGVSVELDGFTAKFEARASNLDRLSKATLEQASKIDGELAHLESLRREARSQIYHALVLDSKLMETQRAINVVMRQRFDTTNQRYEEARHNAVRLAFLAKRAIELRLGVRMEDLRENLQLVDAPASWANSICTTSGINFSTLKEGSDQGTYTDAYIGDYVTKLENLVESYRLAYNFHEADDTAVVSLRDDLLKIHATCNQPVNNLLHHAGDLNRPTKKASPGWDVVGCRQASDGSSTLPDCMGVSPMMEKFEVGPFASANPSASATRTYHVTFGPYEQAVRGQACNSAPCDLSATGFMPGTELSQVVGVNSGQYRLSWYAATAAGTANSQMLISPDAAVTVAFAGERGTSPSMSSVHMIAGDNGWNRYYRVIDLQEAGDLTVAIAPTRTDVPQAVNVAALMLEQLAGGEQTSEETPDPPEPFANTGDQLVSPQEVCEDTTGAAFRVKGFRRDCTQLCSNGFSDDCDIAERGTFCFREAIFELDQRGLQDASQFGLASFARGNYNYRINTIGVNFVGTNTVNCQDSMTPSTCYSQGFIPYSIEHRGPYEVRNHFGQDNKVELFTGKIEHARGLAAERYLTNPLSSADNDLITPYLRTELRGRPLDGNFVVRIWEDPGVDFNSIQDVQLVFNYHYWTRFE